MSKRFGGEENRWDGFNAGLALHIKDTKALQAIKPAFRKVATLMLADPLRTMNELKIWMDLVVQNRFEQEELPIREAMATGRLDRTVVHPDGR